MTLEEALCWYQERIGLYDKQSWETTVEQHIIRGLSYSPCKTAKLKTDLIDVDLVRGSTFPKAKPQSDIWLAGLQGILRLILCPLYFRWWIAETKVSGFLLVITMYTSVAGASLIYYYQKEDTLKDIPWFEVFLPFFLLILLSVIHSQMVCTRRKGIKMTCMPFNNKESYFRKLKTVRKSRSNTRSNIISHTRAKGSYVQLSSKLQNCNEIKDEIKPVGNQSCTSLRSHSEDIHDVQCCTKKSRSSSENNILHCKIQNLPKYGANCCSTESEISNIGNKTILDSHRLDFNLSTNKTGENDDSKNSFLDLKGTIEVDPQLKFRGKFKENLPTNGDTFENKNDSIRNIEISASQHNAGNPSYNFPDLEGEQTSDVGSDEGCSADCESPNTDGEGIHFNLWTKKLKSCVESKAKQNRSISSHYSPRKSIPKLPVVIVEPTVSNSSCESEGEVSVNSHRLFSKKKQTFLAFNSVTTNSEDPSYSSESEAEWDDIAESNQSVLQTETIDWHIQGAPAAVISSTKQVTDKVSCKIWENCEMKKVSLSVLDIASAVISRVDNLKHSSNYLMFGLIMSVILSIIPCLYRLFLTTQDKVERSEQILNNTVTGVNLSPFGFQTFLCLLGDNVTVIALIFLSFLNRLVLGACIFFLLSVAERTFKQRFLYAKHFCYMTSARRARKYDLPHFRLNKVINIKAWLSIRSCLKKRGPQHSIDVIVSATFIVTLILVFYLGVEALKDDEKNLQPLHNCELFVWCFTISIYLVRFMTLGALINKKYSNPSVLITEQINMYFHMEQNPEKKDKLVLANNVLKLVSVLLKELDSPFKISGLYANTMLYNITKFCILSACSGVLSNLLGFKLKLHSIKFR